jgi:hypothetical protein
MKRNEMFSLKDVYINNSRCKVKDICFFIFFQGGIKWKRY